MKRKELLALPIRDWQQVKTYDEIIIVPSAKKHDSGWMLMAIVGVAFKDKEVHREIAGYCDDIGWKMDFNPSLNYWMHTDMYYPAGICRHWGMKYTVGISCSSVDITVTKRPKD